MKKLIVLLLVIAMATSIFASCTNSTTNGTAAPATSAEVSSTQATTAETSAASNSVTPTILGMKLANLDLDGTLLNKYKGQSITIATCEGDFATALKNQKQYFEQITGATVNVDTFPGDSYMDKIQLDLNAGGTFDAVLMPIANIHGYATTGLVADMTSMLNTLASKSYDASDFLPGLFNTYAKYNNQIVALPYKPDVIMNFYRKDLFEDTNVQAQYKKMYGTDLKVPKTLDEYLQVAKFFTKANNPNSPTTYGYCANAGTGNLRWIWQDRLCADGGNVVTQNFEPAFNNDAGVKAMNYMLELAKCAPSNWQEYTWETSNAEFCSGDVAMMEQWPGLYTTTQASGSKVAGKVGASVTAGDAPVLGGWALAISAKSKNQELAFKFCEFCTSKDGEIIKMQNTMDPCRTSNYQRPEVISYNPLYPTLLDSLTKGASIADVDVPVVTSQLNNVLELGCQSVLNGKASPADALKSMSDQFNSIIAGANLKK